jgi:transposase-like protein
LDTWPRIARAARLFAVPGDAKSRLSGAALQELVRMHREGMPVREVARRLGLGPNTERRYRTALAAEGLLEGASSDVPDASALAAAVRRRLPRRRTPQQTSSIAIHAERVAELMAEGLGPGAIHRRLALEVAGFSGTLSAVKRLCLRLAGRMAETPRPCACEADGVTLEG